MRQTQADAIRNLMASNKGSFARDLGMDLHDARSEEVFRWLLAAILFGAPIAEKTAANTLQIFGREGITSPKIFYREDGTGWSGS